MKIDRKSIYSESNLDKNYYQRQLENPYESTKNFFKFLDKKIKLKGKKIVDLACGNGANLIYLKKNFPVKNCYGFDQNKILLKKAKKITKLKKINDLHFFNKNIENTKTSISKKFISDGVICIQTLSVLDDYIKAIKFAKKFKPKFICVNSLFWKGNIDFKIFVNFLKRNKKIREIEKINKYNIYSIQHYLSFLSQGGYTKHSIVKLKTKKNLITKNKFSMGSHTVKINNKNEIKSGPLILDWYFILSQKK